MIRRYINLFLILVLSPSILGQINKYGVPSVVNYPPEITNGSEQNWAIVQDKRGVMYFGNDEKGVLEYDGSTWRTISIPNNSIVRSLACSEEGVVYVGAVGEIGYLAPSLQGNLEYKSLLPLLDSSDKRFTEVWKTYSAPGKVYFHSEKELIIYNTSEKTIKVFENDQHTLFGFYANNEFYFGDFSRGLLRLSGDTAAIEVKGGEYYKEKDIFGLIPYDEEKLLIGATDYGLSLYNIKTGKVDSLFAKPATNRFCSDNFLTSLNVTKSGFFIASTFGGGVAVIDKNGGIIEIISKDQGLQDQTIYSTYQPPANYPFSHLWTAMSIGVGKISFDSPLRKFSENNGYQGLIHTIRSIGETLFIGTSSGLYLMNTKKNFPSFIKVENINRHIWDMENYTLKNGEEVLLVLGEESLYEVHRDGRAIDLAEKIVESDLDKLSQMFWGFSIAVDPYDKTRLYLGRETSIRAIRYKNGNWVNDFFIQNLSDNIRSLAVSERGNLWYSRELLGIGVLQFSHDTVPIYFDETNGLPTKDNNTVFQVGPDIMLGTANGVYKVIDQADTMYFEKDSIINKYLPAGKNYVLYIYQDPAATIWISYENSNFGWNLVALSPNEDNTYSVTRKPFYNLGNFSTDMIFSYDGENIWFPKSNILYHYTKNKDYSQSEYSTLIRKVTVAGDSVIFNGAHPKSDGNGEYVLGMKQEKDMIPSIRHSDNNVEFRWSAPFYEKEEELEFSYFLDGFSKDTSAWEKVLYQDFTNLPQGSYTFYIRARNVYHDISLEDSFSFIIDRPWYMTFVAFLAYVIIAILIVYIIILLYTRRLKNENIRLEGIIQERTTEIRKQKEELTDSIEYASRIQRALLPPDQMLSNHELDHFILFRPRDIVSGDFYWFGSNQGKVFVVAADCTGHGVPGAFMSMLGISFLDEIVIKSGVAETNKILDALRNHVITSLRQTGKSMDESTKDGMDLSMVAIDVETRKVQYSGAYNPLYAVRELSPEEKDFIKKNGDLEPDLERGWMHNEKHLLYQIKADHMPIGISEKDHDFSATFLEDTNATIYLFSDGFVDQFGGPSGKKFMSRNFKKLLLEVQEFSMEKQREKLENTLRDWMGDISQIDDILVIGIKL